MSSNPVSRPAAMTDRHLCEVSALMDGEATDYQGLALSASLARDPGLRVAWERYHLIGQVLRGEPVSVRARAVADAVWERTAAAPAPARVPAARPAAPSWRAPFGGAALAAGAALIAVLAVPGRHQPTPPARLSLPAPAGGTRASAPVLRRWETDRPELAGILDRYLVTHQESAPAARSLGLLPYAVLVAHESPR